METAQTEASKGGQEAARRAKQHRHAKAAHTGRRGPRVVPPVWSLPPPGFLGWWGAGRCRRFPSGVNVSAALDGPIAKRRTAQRAVK